MNYNYFAKITIYIMSKIINLANDSYHNYPNGFLSKKHRESMEKQIVKSLNVKIVLLDLCVNEYSHSKIGKTNGEWLQIIDSLSKELDEIEKLIKKLERLIQ